ELVDESQASTEAVSSKIKTKENTEQSYDPNMKITDQKASSGQAGLITRIGMGAGKVVSVFNQAAKDAVQTVLNTVIPFMAFVALLIGLIEGSGIGTVIANLLAPLAGNILGLIIIGFICSLPFLSPLLGPG